MISIPQRWAISPAMAKDPAQLARLLNDFQKDATNGLAGVRVRAVREVQWRCPQRWIEASLVNSWVAYSASNQTFGFWKDESGFVHLRGAVKSGTYGASAITTLPDGYRPALAIPGAGATQTNATYDGEGRIAISTAGVVTAPVVTNIQTGTSTFLSLENISFEAASTSPQLLGTPITLAELGLSTPATGVAILACFDTTIAQAASAPRVAWQTTRTGVQITQLFGLLPGHLYALRVEVTA